MEWVVVVPCVPIVVPVVPVMPLVDLVLAGRVVRVVLAPRMRSIREGL